VRLDQPYFAFGDLDFEYTTPDVLTGEVNGDVYDRIIVRLLEVKQSIDLIEQCLDRLPAGDIVAEPNITALLTTLNKVTGEGIGRMEAPRGEVFHYVRLTGAESLYSWKVRAPTYNNILPWIPMLLGQQIADIPIIAASIDPCMSCTNRVTLIQNNQSMMVDGERLHRLSIEKTRRLRW
jgi:membrane-bound hydrogenase subunit alpha